MGSYCRSYLEKMKVFLILSVVILAACAAEFSTTVLNHLRRADVKEAHKKAAKRALKAMIEQRKHLGGRCPSAYPFAYKGGQRCCKVNKEGRLPPNRGLGWYCDGKNFKRSSQCCAGPSTVCPAKSRNCLNQNDRAWLNYDRYRKAAVKHSFLARIG